MIRFFNPWSPKEPWELLLDGGLHDGSQLPFFTRGLQCLFGDPGGGKSIPLVRIAAEATRFGLLAHWCGTDSDLQNLRESFMANEG